MVNLIGNNCHSIVIDSELAGRYVKHLQKLEGVPSPALAPSLFLANFLLNDAKVLLEPYAPAQIPEGAKYPKEDAHIVRLGLFFRALVVTEDNPLREAINTQPILGLKALTSEDALALAHEQ